MPTQTPSGPHDPAPNRFDTKKAARKARRIARSDRQNAGVALDLLEPRIMMSGSVLDGMAPGTASGPALVYNPAQNTALPPLNLKNAASTAVPATTSSVPVLGVLNNGAPKGLLPSGASGTDTSEYMLGDVLVNVVLLESNGSVDNSTENWTPTMINNVETQITQGLTWWRDMFYKTQKPAAGEYLNFYTDFTYADNPVSTGYEPISRASTSQGLWIDDFLNTAGVQSSANYMTDVRTFDNDQRAKAGTDWSYTIFVVNSLNDTDGSFTDGYNGYAYVNGPFMVETYDNGSWGINRMKMITAHETGHIFGALDEYQGGNTYNSFSGYYDTQNLNGYDGDPSESTRVTSLMSDGGSMQNAFNSYTSSPSSLQMVGWKDSDGDGIMDVLDVPLNLTATASYNATNKTVTIAGASTPGTLANKNPYTSRHSITLNTVDALQYSIDGGAWTNAATYGSYDAAISKSVSVSALAAGPHTVAFRTINNSLGLTSNTLAATFTIAGSTAPVVTPANSATPLAPDLLAVSDTGWSSTDNLTKLNNGSSASSLQFSVGGTVAGALVNLYADGRIIGSGTATGTTTAITTNGNLTLTDGSHLITATQTEAGKNVSSSSGSSSMQIDTAAPTVTINESADATNVSSIIFSAVFSESVTGFVTGDVTLGGSALATTQVVAGSGAAYTVTASGMSVSGAVTASIAAGVATDAAGNVNVASTSTDNAAAFVAQTGNTSTAPSSSLLTGTVIGTDGAYLNGTNTKAKAFDGSTSTFVDAAAASGAWVGLDLGGDKLITSVSFFPRAGRESRMVGGKFQASNDPTFTTGVVNLLTLATAPAAGWTTAVITTSTAYRYVRYVGPSGSYDNVAEIEFYGTGSGGASNSATPLIPIVPVTTGTGSSNTSNAATSNPSVAVQLSGTAIGTAGSWNGGTVNTIDKAFDGNISTFFDAPTPSGSWTGLDLGSSQLITSVSFYPRAGKESRMLGGKFQASNDPTFGSGVVNLFTITNIPATAWTTAAVTTTTAYRYVRYVGPSGSYDNVAEIEFFGTSPAGSASQVLSAAIGGAPVAAARASTWTIVTGNDGWGNNITVVDASTSIVAKLMGTTKGMNIKSAF